MLGSGAEVQEQREDAVILYDDGRMFLAVYLKRKWRLFDEEPMTEISEALALRREYLRCHDKEDVKNLPSPEKLIPSRNSSRQVSLF